MTYFELFDIPVALTVAITSIKKKFYELSRQYHPDFYSQATEAEQDDALEKSALLNKAYKTFGNKDDTIKYVLQLKGLLEEDEKYKLPPDFLMDMLELNEALMDATAAGDEEKMTTCKLQVTNLENELYENIKSSLENYKDGTTTEKELLPIKDYYFKKKYLNRILASSK